MKQVLLVLCFAALLAPPLAIGDGPREETQPYTHLPAMSEGCGIDLQSLEVDNGNAACFSIQVSERSVRLRITEDSPFVHIEGQRAASIQFSNQRFTRQFCDDWTFGIPPGAVSVRVEVQFGDRADFCGEGVKFSPAFQGNVTATFT